MPVNIGKALLQDPKKREFQFLGQVQILGRGKRHRDFAALREALHQPSGSRAETDFVQHGRMQQIR